MPITAQDENFMAQALELARQGTGLTSPGARVGAVAVDSKGEVAGTGFYTYAGIKHAEVLALEQAGTRARGGTLYLNLEPCSHQGRTGPCVGRVIRAGIRRVVAAIADPNPLVAGKGLAQLREAGIQVDTGLLERQARRVNEGFAKYILNGRPLVTLKSAMTLDGKIASAPDPSHHLSQSSTWITGPEARTHVQQLRHEADAILVGIGTVLADDPLLTDRSGLRRRRPLLRVVLDSRLRLPLDSRLVKTAKNDVMVFSSFPDSNRTKQLEERGVKVVEISDSSGHPDLRQAIAHLSEMEIASLLIEGGARVNGAALRAGIVDKVFFYYAPRIMGDSEAVPLVRVPDTEKPGESILKDISLHRFGEDFAVEGYLRDPYTPAPIEATAQRTIVEKI
jgi:diaminohydroxyphosphoribosylaminopyrimidine deaminase / 5-amino-6-(5-phosphoribosylamino)uracil reductase